ncbi:MAG: DNA polymerase III subunit delta [Firmicutes bacterium]|nr:DNA polymerase III subunit delta [Bacillota bacterium]
MSYKKILEDIKKDHLENVYLCFGNENYLKDWIITKLKKKYINESFQSLNYIYLDGKEIAVKDIVNACETLPFMNDIKVVIVEDLEFIVTNKGNKEDEENLINYIKNPSETTCLLFINKAEKIDKRKKLYKEIKKNGSIIEFNKMKEDELFKWIDKKFKDNKKNITRKDINYFLQVTGYLDNNSNKTLYDLDNEIIKISNYLGNNEKVSKDIIDKILIRSLQNNIFKLVDGLGKRNPETSLTVFNEMLLENEPVQLIMYMIIRQFRLLIMGKLLEQKGYSQKNISKKMKVPGFVARKVLNQGRNLSLKELERSLKKCLEADRAIKTGKLDNKLAVEKLIIEVTGK